MTTIKSLDRSMTLHLTPDPKNKGRVLIECIDFGVPELLGSFGGAEFIVALHTALALSYDPAVVAEASTPEEPHTRRTIGDWFNGGRRA